MAQLYKRPDPNGDEIMVGLNTKTEPVAVIAGAFEILDHARRESLPSGSVVPTFSVFACMVQGYDMSKAALESFLTHYESVFGHPLMKVYSNQRVPLRIGHGGRFMPAKSGKWTAQDWTNLNQTRKEMWQEWIRAEMSNRGWTVDSMLERFSIDLTKLPEKDSKQSFEDTVTGMLNQVLINQARLEDQFQRILMQRRAA